MGMRGIVMRAWHGRSGGFTLVELLVVIAIIGIMIGLSSAGSEFCN